MGRYSQPGQRDPLLDAEWSSNTLALELSKLDRTIYDTELRLSGLTSQRDTLDTNTPTAVLADAMSRVNTTEMYLLALRMRRADIADKLASADAREETRREKG